MYNDKMDTYLQFLKQIEILQSFVKKEASPLSWCVSFMIQTNK